MQLKIKLLLPLLLLVLLFSCCGDEKQHFENFITTNKNELKDGNATYRFFSFNIPNLNYVEDDMTFNKAHPFGFPTSFEIKDALESVKQIGGTVVRNYTFSVKRSSDTLGIPRYILGPGEFNEEAFLVMDTVLAIANEVGVRLILPFVDNWKWMGGVPQYAAFRNKLPREFWTDSLLISDFKKTINYVLNRTNTVTGEKYKDDKAILCWETGNELASPYSWTEEIVKYIKSIDSNHLVMNGYNATDGTDVPTEAINDTLVDILTTHHYRLNPNEILVDIKTQMERIGGKKPYLVGEFGFLGTSAINRILDFIIDNENIVGGLIWSLRYHRDEGGYYWHSEPLGGGIYKAFHWPGSSTGVDYNEEKFMPLFREKAFEIRELDLPKLDIPKPPKLLHVKKSSAISWQGSAGAKYYDVERAESASGDWEVIGLSISDAEQAYTPLFNDEYATFGKEYYYRIIAKNEAGNSKPSNVVGPVKVESKTLIDEMKNATVMYFQHGRFSLENRNDRDFKEIMYRIKAKKGSSLYYTVPGKIISCKVYSFSRDDSASLQFLFSNDGNNFVETNAGRESFYIGKGDYAYWIPSLYKVDKQLNNFAYQFVEIKVNEVNQIARIEIEYIPD